MSLTLGGGGHNPNKDVEVNSPPDDSISSMTWSPKANFLVAGSWDNKVRCWEVQSNGNSIPKKMYAHDAPVLCTTWSADGTKIFSGGCDNKAKCYLLNNDQCIQIGQHNAPIKSLFWMEEPQLLCTGSWDKTIKYWDGRQPNPALSVDLPERLYAMDINYPLAVVGTAERHVIIYDLKAPSREYKRFLSPLKFQTRVVAAFPDKTGFALGSIEGRVAIHHVEDKDSAKNFAFKCHRENSEVYAVNSIAFHPVFGTFATTGSDGTFNFWDKDSKQRLKPFSKCNAPIPCGVFNADGTIFAYAVSYDWSKGVEYYNPQNKNYILLHPTTEAEIKHRDGRKK